MSGVAESWVCDTCGHTIPKASAFGFVGWMADIARHARTHEQENQQ